MRRSKSSCWSCSGAGAFCADAFRRPASVDPAAPVRGRGRADVRALHLEVTAARGARALRADLGSRAARQGEQPAVFAAQALALAALATGAAGGARARGRRSEAR